MFKYKDANYFETCELIKFLYCAYQLICINLFAEVAFEETVCYKYVYKSYVSIFLELAYFVCVNSKHCWFGLKKKKL